MRRRGTRSSGSAAENVLRAGFWAAPPKGSSDKHKEENMGLLDKLLGRGKQAAGDLTGDASLRSEVVHQEKEGRAEESAERHEELASEERTRAAEHRAEREST